MVSLRRDPTILLCRRTAEYEVIDGLITDDEYALSAGVTS